MISRPITSWQIDGETMETVADIFLGSKITVDSDCRHEIKSCGKPSQHIKQQGRSCANKGAYSQCYGFSSSYVWM